MENTVKDRQLLIARLLQLLHKIGSHISWLQCILLSYKLLQSYVSGVHDDIIYIKIRCLSSELQYKTFEKYIFPHSF